MPALNRQDAKVAKRINFLTAKCAKSAKRRKAPTARPIPAYPSLGQRPRKNGQRKQGLKARPIIGGQPCFPELCHAPSGLVIIWPIPQGVALGWHVAPFQGCHRLCREPCRLLCRKRKMKRVDEACRLRVSLRVGLEWVLRSHSLSPHFVTPLCRLRFVPTLRPYALSECEKGASVRYSPAKERSCVGGSASG